MIVENKEQLKKVRKDLKVMGYKIKTYCNSLGRFAEVTTKENEYVLGSTNVFGKSHIEAHKNCFNYFKQFQNNKGNIII